MLSKEIHLKYQSSLKVSRWERYTMKTIKHKKFGVAILMSNKADFKTIIIRNKKRLLIIMKVSSFQKDTFKNRHMTNEDLEDVLEHYQIPHTI